MLRLQPVPLDRAIVAPSIYANLPHVVTNTGLVIENVVKVELEQFLREYCAFLGVAAHEKCFRIDLYFDQGRVYIIEVNVEVADGWGVSLNLQRAAGISPAVPVVVPAVIPTYPHDPRETEFQLAIGEWARLGACISLAVHPERLIDPLDNKLHLARFAPLWRGERVVIPPLFWHGNAAWEDVPEDVYLKFAEKFCVEAVTSRYSAKPRCELGRARQMQRLFTEGRAIAQKCISPFQTTVGEQVQAVVMCAGAHVVTGYIQIAPPTRTVINDKGTKKGALIFR